MIFSRQSVPLPDQWPFCLLTSNGRSRLDHNRATTNARETTVITDSTMVSGLFRTNANIIRPAPKSVCLILLTRTLQEGAANLGRNGRWNDCIASSRYFVQSGFIRPAT